MISLRIAGLLILTATLSAATPSFAREERGQHRTRVVCDEIKSIANARDCMIQVGAKMPTENDENAVLVTRSAEAREVLVELLQLLKAPKEDIAAASEATYFAAVVQNDDEAHIYYYALFNGKNVRPRLLGTPFEVSGLEYTFCPSSDGSPAELPKKYMSIKAMLLGMDPNKTASGTVWLEDAFNDVRCD